ncbi:hypothetical protein AKL49_25670, partial [Salmonella enterica]|nr:hypothetical protein [Salmonella enterica]
MINYDEYAGEKDLVQEFVNYINHYPLTLSNESVFLFIWGYELWMPIGGRHGTAGIPDLIGTDTKGRVWLIEAKHSLNSELRDDIWSVQIQGYRRALATLPSEDIILQSQRYLTNQSDKVSRPHFVSDECDGLLRAFQDWLIFLGIENSTEKAEELFHKTIQSLKTENVINVVLADEFKKNVWESRPHGEFDCAYIKCSGRHNQFSTQTLTDFKSNTSIEIPKIQELEESWSYLQKK